MNYTMNIWTSSCIAVVMVPRNVVCLPAFSMRLRSWSTISWLMSTTPWWLQNSGGLSSSLIRYKECWKKTRLKLDHRFLVISSCSLLAVARLYIIYFCVLPHSDGELNYQCGWNNSWTGIFWGYDFQLCSLHLADIVSTFPGQYAVVMFLMSVGPAMNLEACLKAT